MGQGQGRPSDGGKRGGGGKKSKEKSTTSTVTGATPTKAKSSPGDSHLQQQLKQLHDQQQHQQQSSTAQPSPNSLKPAPIQRALSGQSTAGAPAQHPSRHSPIPPALTPQQQQQLDPTFDENSHPFHAPLDHVREEERPLHELSEATHFDVATLRKLQIIFTDIAESDVDDGIIDGNELTDAMGLKSSCLLARTIFRIFDITQQKKIDFAQWVKTISALSVKASLEEKIRFSFLLYDLNGDGSIDVEELRAMLEAAVLDENVLHLSSEEVREWCDHTLSQVDRDGNGKVDYEEYRSMVQNSVKFIESFTLDIHELCSSFRFKSKRSSEHMTPHEMDQRLLWFRARQRQYNGSHSSQQGSSSQDGSQHETSTPPVSGGGKNNSNGKTRSAGKSPAPGSLRKPIEITRDQPSPAATFTNVAPAAVTIPSHATVSTPAVATTTTVPTANNLFSAVRGTGGFNQGVHSTTGDYDHSCESSPSGSQYAATTTNNDNLAAPSLLVPLTQISEISPSPSSDSSQPTSAAIETNSPLSSEPPVVFHESSTPAPTAIPSIVPSTTPTVHYSGTDSTSPHPTVTEPLNVAPLHRLSHTQSLDPPARQRGLSLEQEQLLRQTSAPVRNPNSQNIHQIAKNTPLHLLRQGTVATIQQEDEDVEQI